MDVLRIALERRESMRREISELDTFIRTAEMLLASVRGQSDSGQSAVVTLPPVQQPKAG